MKGFSSKRIALKTDVLQDRKVYCLQACPRASFSPDNLPAGAVKGLTCELKCQSLIYTTGDYTH